MCQCNAQIPGALHDTIVIDVLITHLYSTAKHHGRFEFNVKAAAPNMSTWFPTLPTFADRITLLSSCAELKYECHACTTLHDPLHSYN